MYQAGLNLKIMIKQINVEYFFSFGKKTNNKFKF